MQCIGHVRLNFGRRRGTGASQRGQMHIRLTSLFALPSLCLTSAKHMQPAHLLDGRAQGSAKVAQNCWQLFYGTCHNARVSE